VIRLNSFNEPQLHFILTTGDLQGVHTIWQIVEAIPVQLMLVFLDLCLECAANDSRIITENGA